MTIVAIINQKGGVGKTTIATNLAHALALDNIPTLLIDLDPQAHSSCVFGEEDVYDIFVNNLFFCKQQIFKPLYARLKKGNVPINNLLIIPSNLKLALIAEQLSGRVHREKLLFNHLNKFDKELTIIIDCPPNLGLLSINGIYAADKIIIPVNYGKYALKGMGDLLYIIKEIKEDKKYEYYVLRNNYDIRNSQTNKFIENRLDEYSDRLLKTTIRKCESLNQCQLNEETIFTFDSKSNGAKDFESLREEWLTL